MIGNMILSVEYSNKEKEQRFLRVPVSYDEAKSIYMARLETPDSRAVFLARSHSLEGLAQEFNEMFFGELKSGSALGEEIYGMFMPRFFFEDDPLQDVIEVGEACEIFKKSPSK